MIKERFLEEGIDAIIISKPTNRRYLSGFTGTSGYLLLTAEENCLITDFRYLEQASIQAEHFSIFKQETHWYDTLKQLVNKYNLKKIGIEKDTITLALYEEYLTHLPGVDFIALADPCARERRIKNAEELKYLQKAVDIADQAFEHIFDILRVGLTEREVAFELEFYMRSIGSEKEAFETIVASGIRSALPHGVASTKVIQAGEFVTFDFGAVYQGYHSDMTRTVVMGTPNSKQKEIYELVLKAQEAVLTNLQPGMKCSQADALARDIIIEAGYGENFGHGLGHGVGLDIHEGPRLSPLDETILEPGMTVTVEPGVYIQGWSGVRIEDLVVITSRGCEILTKSPKNLNSMMIPNK